MSDEPPVAEAPVETDSPAGISDNETSSEPVSKPERTVKFSVTDSIGWHYAGTLPYPDVQMKFSKDISSSPPGFAQLSVTMTGGTIGPETFYNDNPGRPNGPELEIGPGYMALPIPSKFTQGDTSLSVGDFGPCQIGGQEDSAVSYEPFNHQARCRVDDLGFTEGTSVDYGDEAQIDRFILVANPAARKATYVLNLDPTSRACNFFIDQSGLVTPSDQYKFQACGMEIKLTPNF